MHPSQTLETADRAGSGSTRGVIVGAIPARWGSTRLPGKALRELAGRPMIEHVYRRAEAVPGLDRVVVLTDDERVERAVRGFGGRCQMTPASCPSGTDRIAWAARQWQQSEAGPAVTAVVNLQGDEPLLDPAAVGRLAAHLAAHPEEAIATLAAPEEPAILTDPHVVKVVRDNAGYALYFSRAPIPYPRGVDAHELHERGHRPLRHIGVYGYRLDVLLELASLGPSPLEQCECLEQLRALENGIRIRVLEVPEAWPGVDTMADLEVVEALLREEESRRAQARKAGD